MCHNLFRVLHVDYFAEYSHPRVEGTVAQSVLEEEFLCT